MYQLSLAKWVNRGFLHGPALPIYGSGAIVILVSTIGVKRIYTTYIFVWYDIFNHT